MKTLIVGLGSIGRRHLKNLRRIEPDAHITVLRRKSTSRNDDEVESLADCVAYDLEKTIEASPDAALITSPSAFHIETGLSLARHGIHLFIEKPFSNTLDGVDELMALCHERSLVLAVGYNLRFCRSLGVMRQALIEGRIGSPIALRAEVGQYLPEWRPESDYRDTVSARKALGGGALLELSHELDYVRWLVGEVRSVSAQLGQLSGLDIDVEDTAEIILGFTSGAIGSVHLNMIQRPATRMCRIIGTEGTLTWDGLTHQVRLFSATGDTWVDLHGMETVDRNDMYVAELRQFLECVRGNNAPTVKGEDGRRALEIAIAARTSFQEQRVVCI